METEQEKYSSLYNQYRVLVEKTTLKAENLQVGGTIKINNISPQDLQEKIDVQKKILDGLSFLSDDQLIVLSEDDFLGKEANDVLVKRKMSN